MSIKTGLAFLVTGQADFEIRKENRIIEKCPVRPFHLFSLLHLLPRFRKTYQISWAPVLKMMELCPGISEINSDFQNISNDFVESSFMLGRNHVLRNVEYLERFKK